MVIMINNSSSQLGEANFIMVLEVCFIVGIWVISILVPALDKAAAGLCFRISV